MVKVCAPRCNGCRSDQECIELQSLRQYNSFTQSKFNQLLARMKYTILARLDLKDAERAGFTYLPLDSGLYDA